MKKPSPMAALRSAAGRKGDRPSPGQGAPSQGQPPAGGDAARETQLTVPCFRTNGALVDLADLCADDIDFGEMAIALSKIARFNGIDGNLIGLSVAQHCVMGADALFRETGDGELAGYFLLHDGHEYLIGDITRPAIRLIDHFIAAHQMAPRSAIRVAGRALDLAKLAIDRVIINAAGRPAIHLMPLYARQVREMDERMCAAEASALFGATGDVPLIECHMPPPKLTGAIAPWPAAKAKDAFIDRLEKYLGIVVRAA